VAFTVAGVAVSGARCCCDGGGLSCGGVACAVAGDAIAVDGVAASVAACTRWSLAVSAGSWCSYDRA
jgi:hypothetical protein